MLSVPLNSFEYFEESTELQFIFLLFPEQKFCNVGLFLSTSNHKSKLPIPNPIIFKIINSAE